MGDGPPGIFPAGADIDWRLPRAWHAASDDVCSKFASLPGLAANSARVVRASRLGCPSAQIAAPFGRRLQRRRNGFRSRLRKTIAEGCRLPQLPDFKVAPTEGTNGSIKQCH